MSETQKRYTASGSAYLKETGGNWHLEDSPFKASQILKMLQRNRIQPTSVMEIGCGAGGILANLAKQMGLATQFAGYDISPDAHAISKQFESENLRFILGEAWDQPRSDLVLAMDVIEHVEDCFGFLRKLRAQGDYKIYHIPLDIHASAALRDSFMNAWHSVGHIHVFSRSIALQMLRDTGHEILDWFYTPGALSLGKFRLKTFLANLPRRILPQSLASRLVGGFSLLVLAR
ncbi:MAG TPA: methyltransferase domain-containing protein [Tepidisphaeraceae bacterium]|nr:methyltransferase domain-containing protein [Tepidisphaeraceae bacterium]